MSHYTEYKNSEKSRKRFTKNLFAEVLVEGEETNTVLHIHNT